MRKQKIIPPKPTRNQFASEAEYEIHLHYWNKDYGSMPLPKLEPVKIEADTEDYIL